MLKYHRKISLSSKQKLKLGSQLILNSIFWFLKPIKNEMTELYNAGKMRIDKKLDLVKICNDITYLKLLTKFYLKPPIETQF